MRWLVFVVVAMGCGGAPAKPGYELPPVDDSIRREGTEKLLAATGRHDAAAIAGLLATNVVYGGLWFTDSHCRVQFSAPGEIQPGGIEAFAKCLATLSLTTSERKNPFADIAVLTYDPGIEIEVLFDREPKHRDVKVKWIGFVSRREVKDALPTVTQHALEVLRSDGTVLDDDARGKLDQQIARRPKPTERKGPIAERGSNSEPRVEDGELAWFKICIDTAGAVTGVHPRMATSLVANNVLSDFVKQWTFRPFLVGEQPTPVCSLIRVEYPVRSGQKPVFPYPVSDPTAIIVSDHSMRRTAGDVLIVPDDLTKQAIHQSGVTRTLALVMYCTDVTGSVRSVSVVRSSGFVEYDQKLVRGVSKFRFEPLLFDGVPTAVCSHLLFAYSSTPVHVMRHNVGFR